MSTLDEKLEQPPTTTSDVAKCKLKHLKLRWGVEGSADWRKAELVQVRSMGYVEHWHRDGPGDDAWWSCIERRKE